MKKAILKYIRLMKSMGYEELRIIGYMTGKDDHLHVHDIAECGNWLRKNNRVRTHLGRLIDIYSTDCAKVKIEVIGNPDNKFSIWND